MPEIALIGLHDAQTIPETKKTLLTRKPLSEETMGGKPQTL